MGIDVGGTNVKIGIVDRQGGMESRSNTPPLNCGKEKISLTVILKFWKQNLKSTPR